MRDLILNNINAGVCQHSVHSNTRHERIEQVLLHVEERDDNGRYTVLRRHSCPCRVVSFHFMLGIYVLMVAITNKFIEVNNDHSLKMVEI